MASTVKGAIKGIASKWKKARKVTKNDSGDFIPVAIGMYIMQLVAVTIDTFNNKRQICHKWVVVRAPEDEEQGKICTAFEDISDADRFEWVQRLMVSCGIDLDEVDNDPPDTEADLLALFEDRVDEYHCSQVSVTEKDGYTNMRVKKLVEVDDSEVYDPADALATSGDGDNEEESEEVEETEEEEARDFQVGDRVNGEEDGETIEGEVTSTPTKGSKVQVTWDDYPDDPEMWETEDLTLLDAAEPEEGEDEESEESENEDEENEVEVGDDVLVDHNGEETAGVVKDVYDDDTVDVKVEGVRKVQNVAVTDISFPSED